MMGQKRLDRFQHDNGVFDHDFDDDEDEGKDWSDHDESLSDDVGRLLEEDAYLDAEFESRTELPEFDE
jgi:hypothetical protein